jgi:hypothetical protein
MVHKWLFQGANTGVRPSIFGRPPPVDKSVSLSCIFVYAAAASSAKLGNRAGESRRASEILGFRPLAGGILAAEIRFSQFFLRFRPGPAGKTAGFSGILAAAGRKSAPVLEKILVHLYIRT